MKTTLLILAVILALIWVAPAQSTANSAWNARLAALEEEHAEQAGVAVSIIFDDSGSMSRRNKMTMAKQAFRAWIADAPASYRFGLVALNGGKLVDLKRDNKAEVLAAVERLQPNGDTPLANTIARVGQEIRQRREAGALYERQVAVILTDGEDNTSRGNRGVQEEIQRLRADRVEVIAFGYQGEGDYMRDCATHFFSPENEQDIRRGLNAIAAEIGDTSDVVVDDATRAQMHAASNPLPAAAAAPSATPAPQAPPIVVSSKPAGSSHWFFKFVILVLAVYCFFGRGKKR